MHQLFLAQAVKRDKGSATPRSVNGIGFGKLRVFAFKIAVFRHIRSAASAATK